MVRRYKVGNCGELFGVLTIQDAVRVFSNILVYIVRTQHVHSRLITGYDNLAKKRDQVGLITEIFYFFFVNLSAQSIFG